MLKTYRIIPLVFILCLFGFTLITVSPVIAQPVCTPDPNYDGGKMCRQNPNARSYQECMGRCNASTSPSGGEVAQLNAKISGLEAGLTELKGVVRALQEQSQNPIQPVAPTAPSGGEVSQLSAKVEELHEAITKGHLPPNHRHKMLCNYDPKTGYRCGQFTSRMGDGYKGTNYGE
jgi:hypothetical protein